MRDRRLEEGLVRRIERGAEREFELEKLVRKYTAELDRVRMEMAEAGRALDRVRGRPRSR